MKRLLAGALVILLLAASCGGSKQAAQGPPPTTSAAVTTTTVGTTTTAPPTTTSTTAPTTLPATTSGVATTASGTTTTTTTAPPPPPITTEAELLTAIHDQGLTAARAEELFALDIGPLPGVSVKGITPEDSIDGTMAVGYLYAEWRYLSQAQQDAATRLTTSSDVESLPRRRAPPATTPTPAGVPATTISAVATTAALGRGLGGRRRAQLADLTEPDYLAMALQADDLESEFTRTPAFGNFDIEISDDMGKAYAETSLYRAIQLPVTNNVIWTRWPDDLCHITVYAPKMAGLSTDDVEAIMAHEVFHCYQARVAGSGPAQNSLSAWVVEGEATWVMAQLDPGATVESKSWSSYTFTPTTVYTDRAYDAIGVYGHDGDVSGDQDNVWPKLLPMVSADVGGHDSAAFSLLLGSDSQKFYDAWGPSYFEHQSQADWHMAGPSTPPSAGPTPKSVYVGNGDAEDLSLLGPYQAAQVMITGNADILVVILASGYGELHDSDFKVSQTLSTGAPIALCLKQGGCKCPDGSPGASEHTISATGPISVGLNGGDTTLAAYAAGEPLDRFCKHPQPPGPPGPGGSGGGAGGGGEPDNPLPHRTGVSSGDPHISTFDGRYYDMQAAGEFTLVKSTTDDFDVQVRTVPLPGSNSVAVNQALAAQVGDHRVEVELTNDHMVALVDGAPDNQAFKQVGPGTVQNLATEAGNGFVVEWPDGTTVQLGQMGNVGLNIEVTPAPARQGKLVGLLGNGTMNARQGFITPGGTDLGPTVDDRTIDGAYADSWRVTQAQSLFVYAKGQTTATFTDRTFPRVNVDANNAPGAAEARKECEADGVSDKYLLESCIVDLSAVEEPAVVEHYAQAQLVQSVQSAVARHVPPADVFATTTTPPTTSTSTSTTLPARTTTTTAVAGEPTLVDTGLVANVGEEQSFKFKARAGEVIWLGPAAIGCMDTMVFALIDPRGKTLDPTNLQEDLSFCQGPLRLDLDVTGTYQLVANPAKNSTGSYTQTIEFVRPDVVRQAKYGEELSGYIPQTAAQDVYLFHANAGDWVIISGHGCDIGNPAGPMEIWLGSDTRPYGQIGRGTALFYMDCSQGSGDQQIPTCPAPVAEPCGSGMYALVVNSYDHGPGKYHFVLQMSRRQPE